MLAVKTKNNSNKQKKLYPLFFYKDVWDLQDVFFERYRENCSPDTKFKSIDFSIIENNVIRDELKEFAYKGLIEEHLKLSTLAYYFRKGKMESFNDFLKENRLLKYSLEDLYSSQDIVFRYKLFLNKKGFNESDIRNLVFINQAPKFLYAEENIEDIWDVRDIDDSKIAKHHSNYKINFSNIKDNKYKEIAKRYVRFRLTKFKHSTCVYDVRVATHFFNYLSDNLISLQKLHRKDVETYLAVLQEEDIYKKDFMISLRGILRHAQITDAPLAPNVIIDKLIFSEDIPKKPIKSANSIKYLPEEILEQLENNLEHLSPAKYIPVIIVLRASGWRISDVLNLRYHNCLVQAGDDYYLSGDIQKTQILEHRIPITKEIAAIVKDCIEHAKKIQGNKDKYLFTTDQGRRKGLPYASGNITDALERFAKKCNIRDKDGKIFKFKTHAFRHTKAVELINNGMNLVHVQKWLAHLTSVMTLHYAKLLDTTMKTSWENATKDGLFKLDGIGNATKVDISNIQDEDIVEWEWIKHNLDAVRMPLGYCMKPNKMECATQLNPCLTCRSLCTTPEFMPAFEQEIMQTKEIINKGKSQNRIFWVEKNEVLLNKLESVLSIIKNGKIKHDAGKQGREYVGEQRK